MTACRERTFRRSSRTGRLGIESLEPRQLLATLVSASKVTYQDVDGDTVTVSFSKSFLTSTNVNSVLAFNVGSVNGTNVTPQRLHRITLTGISAAAGTNITTSAVRNPVTGGDGLATLGAIDALGLDLGNVTIDGDLGRIVAGDANAATPGLGTIKVHSMGRFGTTTGAPNLNSDVDGRVTSLTVTTDVKEVSFQAFGGANGRLGALTIGGSFIGGAAAFAGFMYATGDMGPVKIGGDVIAAGSGQSSGSVHSQAKLASISIRGSLIGGPGNGSGRIRSSGDMGPAEIGGNVIGANGAEKRQQAPRRHLRRRSFERDLKTCNISAECTNTLAAAKFAGDPSTDQSLLTAKFTLDRG